MDKKHIKKYNDYIFDEENWDEEEIDNQIFNIPSYMKRDINDIQNFIKKLIQNYDKKFMDNIDIYIWVNDKVGLIRIFHENGEYIFNMGISKLTSRELFYFFKQFYNRFAKFIWSKGERYVRHDFSNEIIIRFNIKEELIDFLDGCGFETENIKFD